MKNKRWREYVCSKLRCSDPQRGALADQQHAFKAGYNAGKKDALQLKGKLYPVLSYCVNDQEAVICPTCGMVCTLK